ncbi:alpha/beta hydrolase domain-containing protein [Acidimicrobiia bacterium EGI L10123]|uniref:alpha/beta hydrolase domain-containing protein n=1 Tax=Salinilacustrithrix flava TaxID=2957203 RepID=UPI003D7C1778|nr:alpha/beta hydrolase domain-containing protein [Acidimicrobiia bacterium EGI L10123]
MPVPRRRSARSRRTLLALVAAAALVACSGDDEPASPTTAPIEATTTSSASPTTTAPDPGPELTVTGPVAGTPQTSATAGLEEAGYVEEEFFVSGTAQAFDADGEPADDGRWSVSVRDEAPYTTRILVKRPADAADASGVVVVEWNNVSVGTDGTPDWTFTAAELLRSGHVHVAVSAQAAGVDDAGEGGILGGTGNPLTVADPERYGELAHPGDDHSYDLFAQIGALVSDVPADGVDPLAGLPRDHVLAIGESQSAFRLTTFVNGVHPLRPVFDGFLVHSRGGGAAPLDGSAEEGLASSIAGEIRIRDDLDVPVLVFSTETDLTLLGYAPARQPDSDRVRSWEVAGTAHADAFLLGGDPVAAGEALGCAAPVNDGPQHLALKAALAHLVDWVADGTEPPSGTPIEVGDDGEIARDDHGNALGGIRLPAVEVPAATLSGDTAGGSVLCQLFGFTDPFPIEVLVERYGGRAGYLEQYEAALDRAIDAGFVLEADRATALAEAEEVDFG